MVYVPVYSPDGEFFEVIREIADDLILNKGWTQTKPEYIEPDTKTKKETK